MFERTISSMYLLKVSFIDEKVTMKESLYDGDLHNTTKLMKSI